MSKRGLQSPYTVMDKKKILEESLLHTADVLAEQANDNATKILADLFKSAILKKYKDAFDQERSEGKVHKENLFKAVDFCFADACVTFRQMSEFTDEEKECDIKEARLFLGKVKQMLLDYLVCNNIEVI